MLGVEEVRQELIGAGQLTERVGLNRIGRGVDEAEIAVAEALGAIERLGLKLDHTEAGGALSRQPGGVDGPDLCDPVVVAGDGGGAALDPFGRKLALQRCTRAVVETEVGGQRRVGVDCGLADFRHQGVSGGRRCLGERRDRSGKRRERSGGGDGLKQAAAVDHGASPMEDA